MLSWYETKHVGSCVLLMIIINSNLNCFWLRSSEIICLITCCVILCSRYTNQLWKHLLRRKIRWHRCKVKLGIFINLSFIEVSVFLVVAQKEISYTLDGSEGDAQSSVTVNGHRFEIIQRQNTNWPHGFQQGENTNAHTETQRFTCVYCLWVGLSEGCVCFPARCFSPACCWLTPLLTHKPD